MVILLADYSAYDLRVNLYENGDRGRYINDFRNMAVKNIISNPSYKTNVLVSGISKNMLVINTKFPNEKVIHSFDDEKCFSLGELVNYKGSHWLVVEENPDDDVYLTGRMKQCNYLLRWQNPKTYEIIERWSVVENPYTTGLDESKTITVGGNQYRIKMQYDEETKLLHLDKRFLIGLSNNEPIAYTTVRFDDITNTVEDNSRGFLTIVVEQDVLKSGDNKHNDNKEFMIADYITPPPLPSPSIGSCEIVYKGDPLIKIGGSAKVFTAIFKDSDGNQIETITPNWEIVPNDLVSLDKILILSTIGNEINIKASDSAQVGTSFVLKVSANSVEHGFFEHPISLEVGDLW